MKYLNQFSIFINYSVKYLKLYSLDILYGKEKEGR